MTYFVQCHAWSEELSDVSQLVTCQLQVTWRCICLVTDVDILQWHTVLFLDYLCHDGVVASQKDSTQALSVKVLIFDVARGMSTKLVGSD